MQSHTLREQTRALARKEKQWWSVIFSIVTSGLLTSGLWESTLVIHQFFHSRIVPLFLRDFFSSEQSFLRKSWYVLLVYSLFSLIDKRDCTIWLLADSISYYWTPRINNDPSSSFFSNLTKSKLGIPKKITVFGTNWKHWKFGVWLIKSLPLWISGVFKVLRVVCKTVVVL